MQQHQTDALVSAAHQQLCDVYDPEQALCRGTLFPELDKPLQGVRCACSPCATSAQQHDFAAWELRLYLDLHPDDQQALRLYRQQCALLGGRGYACVEEPAARRSTPARTLRAAVCEKDIAFTRPTREETFIPVEGEGGCAASDRWTWSGQPWPWEGCAACRKEA